MSIWQSVKHQLRRTIMIYLILPIQPNISRGSKEIITWFVLDYRIGSIAINP